MTILRALREQADRHCVDFILCDGYAVNAYQVIRKTGDVDLLVRATDAATWEEILLARGYSLYHRSEGFLPFSPPDPSAWPVDLMLVDDRTFETMRAAARPFSLGGADYMIPSVTHLMAMKLHALKHSGEPRTRKDAVDIVELAEAQGIDLRGEDFRRLCEKFADRRTYERVLVYAGESTDG